MFSAGETKANGIELISMGSGEGLSSSDAVVRLYSKNGMVWTVYRKNGKPGLGSILRRVREQIRRGRRRLLKFLMQPWA